MAPLLAARLEGAKQAAVIAVGKKVKRTVNKVVDGIDTGEKEEVERAQAHPVKIGSWVVSVGGAVVAYLVATNKVTPELGELMRELIAIAAPNVAQALENIALPQL